MAGRRSDAKQKMVVAARRLIRERGYHATALSDVLELSEAPRGSVYFHFPGGKSELAVEAAEQHTREQIDHIEQAEASSPAGLVRSYLDQARERLVASDYREGCTIAPIVIEGELGDLGGRLFTMIIEAMAARLEALGLDGDAAGRLAEAVVTGAQGALVTSRALRSPTPFDSVRAALENLAVSAEADARR
ncbi:TetR/AcrR family transcriptional regulator [Kutzneria sp. CA-103260]|uniref:TetR/AcrR family transcriptional regulator n=1 Tax=Kutzneria sp. CA-103260 TaxID=2802641 RepID=UPI001BA51638|nr:TetR/AcrR family transcriptional regulator [Kutzneria sp. CA-103260]QUQ67205.1 transcriptional regulator [Kutzneria sp. CA-103260]